MIFQLDRTILDLDARALTAEDGRSVSLPPKEFELLRMLIERRPHVVSKDSLHQALWPNTYVSESSLATIVAHLRELLGDQSRTPRYIRTAHRVGYAFVGRADAVDTDPAGAPVTAAIPIGYSLVLANQQLPLTRHETVIGRDAGADIALRYPGVSRRHARIVIEHGQVTVEDLGSKNGTIVRGSRLIGSTVLHDGDQMAIGGIVLTFRTPSNESSASTATVNV